MVVITGLEVDIWQEELLVLKQAVWANDGQITAGLNLAMARH